MKPSLHPALLACAGLALLAGCATTEARPSQHAAASEQGSIPQLTPEDGEAIRTALVLWLQRSQLGDRDELLSITENAAVWRSADALLHVGRWAVVAEQGGLTAKLRLGAATGQGPAFDAALARDGEAWIVREITPVHVHARR